MKSQVKERIYLMVMIFCLLMCAILLISVFCDLPLATVKREPHTPVVRNVLTPAPEEVAPVETLTTHEGLVMTEEALAQQMKAFLPSSFPSGQFEVDIKENGSIEAEFAVTKEDLKGYFDNASIKMGIKESILLGMMPQVLEIEVCMQCLSADANGIHLSPQRVTVNDKEMALTFLPGSMLEAIGGAMNAALAYTGYDYTSITFGDGVIIME